MFELPSFEDSANHKRCLIPVDGFYEYHHKKGKTFPFYISRKDANPMVLAGLWSEWLHPADNQSIVSCNIVTTKANKLMTPRIKRSPYATLF